MIAQPKPLSAHPLANLFGGRLGTNFSQFAAGYSTLCLTFLTYIYIFYIEWCSHHHCCCVKIRYPIWLGRLGTDPSNPQKSAPFSVANLSDYGWALPNLMRPTKGGRP